jgi:hypothetical protein
MEDTHTHTHTHSLTRSLTRTHTHARARTHTHTRTHTHAHARTHAHTHTHTHTHNRARPLNNPSGHDAEAGYYITEPIFLIQLCTWAVSRLYLYPLTCVLPTWRCVDGFSSWDTPMQLSGLYLMWFFLSFLLVLHVWW